MKTPAPQWLADGLAKIWLPYTQMKGMAEPLAVRRAEGVRLELADGTRLLDGVGSWWTNVHGYNHPHIRAAIGAQLETLPHVMLGGLAHEQPYRLAARLSALLGHGLNRTFFSDSGSVAVEVAMKMALQYFLNRGAGERKKFVSFLGGYHGDTLGAMSVCDPEEGMHALFRGALLHQYVLPLPANEETAQNYLRVLDERGEEIAGVIVEPLIQGAGGMRMHGAKTLRRIAEGARAAGALVVFDEIFTGFGRTGTLFAFEQAGVAPDIVCLGKALTGGFLGLAATVASDGVFAAFHDDDAQKALMHGPTYMGNALACAAANASLDLFEQEPRLAQVRTIEKLLREGLEEARGLPNVADVRVKGAAGCIELKRMPERETLNAHFAARGVFLRPFGKILYTTPAYVTEADDIAALCAALVSAAGIIN